MGINDEYSRDAYIYDLAYDSDDSDDDITREPLHPEDWQDWYSEQLLDAWMTIWQYAHERYMKVNSSYPRFVEFVMSPNEYYTEDPPNIDTRVIWNTIKDIQVIKETISAENFNRWAELNIEYIQVQ